MDRIDGMKSFVRVVETGSFSAVAREFNTTQPTISKQIAALEHHLDVQLLTRSTRKLHLTVAGERFYVHCQQVLAAVDEAESSVGRRQLPSGTLRVNCPVSFGQLQVMPRIKGFLNRYPEIRLELNLSDRFIDFVEEGVDLAIRIGQAQDTALIYQQLGLTRRVAIAATPYLATHREPQTPADLAGHNCIVYTPIGSEWRFQSPTGAPIHVTVSGNFQTDNSVAVREAVLSGLGIAVSPIWLFGDLTHSEHLRVILPDYQPQPLPIQAVYRRGRFIPAKVRCFIDYLHQEFKLDPWVSDDG